MSEFRLSTTVISPEGDRLYTFEYAALVTETSTIVIEQYLQVGLIEAIGSMLRSREIARIAQIQRLRQDLGVNIVGAVMVLDMAQEIAQLRASLNSSYNLDLKNPSIKKSDGYAQPRHRKSI